MIKIRRIEEKDIETVVDITIESWRDTYKGIISDDFLNDMDRKELIERRKKDYNQNGFIVAEVNGQVVGFCRYTTENIFSKQYEKVDSQICAFYLRPRFKRKGIGSKIFKKVIKELKNNGNKKMIIGCLKDNKDGRMFYEKMGGKIYDERFFEINEKDGIKKYKEVVYIYDIEEVYKNIKG